MIPVRQSTALETAIGPVLDANGVAVTGCVVGDFKIKKTTGNFAALNGSATLTHVSAGMYDLVLTTSDTDTVGLCCIAIDDTTNACAPLFLQVMEEAIYDALYAASANAWSGSAGSSVGAANVTQFGGSAGTFSSGRPEVNTTHLAGTSQTARDIGASVLLSNGTGTGQVKLASGYVAMTWADIGSPTTSVNLSGTTISTSQQVASVSGSVGSISGVTFPTNFSAFLIGSDGTVRSNVVRTNTAQAGASGSITLDASASSVTDFYKHQMVRIVSGTGAGQSRLITAYNGTTKVATIESGSHDWVTNPDNTSVFDIIVDASKDLQSWAGQTVAVATIGGNTYPLTYSDLFAIRNGQQSATDLKDFADDGYDPSTNKVQGVVLVDTTTTNTDMITAAGIRSAIGLATANLDTQIATLATAAALAAVAADLPNRITKNTALSGFTFLMIDSADHVTAKTGLTVTATRSIDGAAFGACANAVSEVSAGVYKIDLAAADLNGNVIMLKFTATGADARYILLATQPT